MKTAEKYLKKVSMMKKRLLLVEDELEVVNGLLTKVTSGPLQQDVVMTSRDLTKQENLIVELSELKDKYNNMFEEYKAIREEIIGEILELENPVYSNILYYRFIEEKKFDEISERIGYTYRWTQELYQRSVKEFALKHLNT